MFITFSIVAITIGMILFGLKVHQRQMFDIEFVGGTSVQFDVNHPMSKDELRGHSRSFRSSPPDLKGLDPNALLALRSSRSAANKYTSYEVVTPSTNAVAVRDAVMKALVQRSNLKLELPSNVDVAEQIRRDRHDQLANHVVIGIEAGRSRRYATSAGRSERPQTGPSGRTGFRPDIVVGTLTRRRGDRAGSSEPAPHAQPDHRPLSNRAAVAVAGTPGPRPANGSSTFTWSNRPGTKTAARQQPARASPSFSAKDDRICLTRRTPITRCGRNRSPNRCGNWPTMPSAGRPNSSR